MVAAIVTGPIEIFGGKKNDILNGSARAETILGLKGDDSIFAGLGDDILDGGAGRDRLDGGGGNNTLIGGMNDDTFVMDSSLEDAFHTIVDFEASLGKRGRAGHRPNDKIEITNVDGKAVLLVQNDASVDIYVDRVKVATVNAEKGGVLARVVKDNIILVGDPESFLIGEAPSDNRAPEVGRNGYEFSEDTNVQHGTLLDFVTDADGDTLTFRLIADRDNRIAVSDEIVEEVQGPPGFTLNPNGSWTFDTNNPAYDSLNTGDVAGFRIAFEVSDGNGGVTQGTLYIDLNGEGEPPNLAPIVPEEEIEVAVTEDTGLITGTLLDHVSDPDSPMLTFTTGDKTPPGFTLNSDGSWSIETGNGNFDDLAAGETLPFGVEFSVEDDEGGVSTGVLVFNVTGVEEPNVAPVVDGPIDLYGYEDGSATYGSLGIFVTDPDSDELTYTVGAPTLRLDSALPEGFTLDSNGDWSFTGDSSYYDDLDTNEVAEFTVAFTVSDNEGGETSGSLTLFVYGATDNQSPVAGQGDYDLDEGSGTQTGTLQDLVTDDASLSDLTFIVLPEGDDGGAVFGSDGSWSIDTDNPAFNSLGAGQAAVFTYNYSVTDANGASDTGLFTFTVAGTNDEPDVLVKWSGGEASEDGPELTGNLVDDTSDPDGDTLTFSPNEPLAGFSLASDGSWSFDPTHSAYSALSAGEVLQKTVFYTASDGNGGETTGGFLFDIVGTNDAPETTPQSADFTEGNGEQGGNLAPGTSDPDFADSLIFSFGGSVDGFTLFEDGSWSFDTSNAAYDYLDDGDSLPLSIGYTVSDGRGGETPGELTINVYGVTDAVNTAPIVQNSDGGIYTPYYNYGSFSYLATDLEGDTLTFSVIEGYDGFELSSDGSWSFNTNISSSSQVPSVTVTYSVSDGLLETPGSFTFYLYDT